MLLLRPLYVEGEGPQGYLLRLAQANGLCITDLRGRSFKFDLAMLTSMGYLPPDVQKGHAQKAFSTLEALVRTHPRAWNWEVARYCPLCLNEAPYWRAEWELLNYDGCSRHALWLRDQCAVCGCLIDWRRPELLRCRCGANLKAQPSPGCPASVVQLSHSLQKAIYQEQQERGIALLNGLHLTHIQRLVRFLAAYGDVSLLPPQHNVSSRSRMDISWHMTSLAAEILVQWPTAFFHMLEHRQTIAPSVNVGSMAGRLGKCYALIYRAFPEREFDFLRRGFEEFVADHWRGSFGRRNRRLVFQLPKLMAWIPAAEAMRLLGISRSRLAHLISQGRINAESWHGASGRTFLVVKRTDVEAESVRKASELDLTEAAYLLGLKKRRAAALLPMLIAQCKGRDKGSPWRIPRQPLEQLLDLVDTCIPVDSADDAHVSLSHILRYWVWPNEALGALLRACLENEIRPVVRLRSGTGIGRMIFDRMEIEHWYLLANHKSRASFTVPEIAERLAVKQEVAYFLVRSGLLRAEKSTNGRRMEARISPHSLDEFEAAFVFGRDLAAHLNTSSQALSKRLARLGIWAICGPGVDSCRQLLYARNEALGHAMAILERNSWGVDATAAYKYKATTLTCDGL